MLGSLLACVVLVSSLVLRRRSAWFLQTAWVAMILASGALAFAAHAYQIDYTRFHDEEDAGSSQRFVGKSAGPHQRPTKILCQPW
ncbi:hypothetical protein SAMN02745166_03161 [Prosthecobacter debontii]|uniref:Uncharacterized protein n=1 Tax=Prosthecobacter debontii TaxID=48467 RepID=A0A1T4YG11_9BACT|nr:hypothetical protein SAMN02745166_03161 [Prosthecobacter debontii]